MILSLARLRVLCVDDHPDAADSTGALLEMYGCEVAICYDAETAFSTALRFKPDVCLIDLNMPNMDGCELAMRLSAWRCERPLRLIAVTAYGSELARRATNAAGFDRHLVIPIDWDELLDILEEQERSLGRCSFINARRAKLLDNEMETPNEDEAYETWRSI